MLCIYILCVYHLAFFHSCVPGTVDLSVDRKIIVCALAALGNPTVGMTEEGLMGDPFYKSCRQTRK
jgi:hypothetical protein